MSKKKNKMKKNYYTEWKSDGKSVKKLYANKI